MSNYPYQMTENEILVDPITHDLLNNNRIYLTGEVTPEMAIAFISRMDFLINRTENQFVRRPIDIYIHSPGGEVNSGLCIIDKIQEARDKGFIVRTVNCGISASMASVILAAGTPGERYSVPSGRVMIHQPLGGAQGQASDMVLVVEQISALHDVLAKTIGDFTHHRTSEIKKLMNRDKWFTAKEAKEFNLIDKIGFPKPNKEV